MSLRRAFDEGVEAAWLHLVKTAATVDELRAAYRRLAPVRINQKGSWIGPHLNTPTKQIIAPAGGATRTQNIWGAETPVSGEGQRALNILGGLHEGFERGSLSRLGPEAAGFHGHHSPRVLLDENNLLASLRGAGGDEARRSFQSMRGTAGESTDVAEAVKRLSGGRMPYTYGETRLPKAMKSRLETLLQGLG